MSFKEASKHMALEVHRVLMKESPHRTGVCIRQELSHPTQTGLEEEVKFCRNSFPPSASEKAQGARVLKW